jgi:hypothetical protein
VERYSLLFGRYNCNMSFDDKKLGVSSLSDNLVITVNVKIHRLVIIVIILN